MPTIVISTFGGEVPRTTPRLLEQAQAQKAINCQLERGHLAALRGPAHTASLKASARTIWKHPVDGWLEWPKPVNVVKSAVYDYSGDEPLGHLFITGDRDYPTQYLAGGQVYRLGVPRPEKAPDVCAETEAKEETVECYAYGSEDGTRYPPRYGYSDLLNEIANENATATPLAVAESHEDALEEGITTDSGIERSSCYCYTLVQTIAGGIIQQESAPSPPSGIIDVLDGDGVRISGFEIPNLPGSNITHIRIYRTLSGTQSSEFHFLVELELPVDSWVDTVLDKDVSSEVLQTTTWDPIPDDAQGLILTNNGIYAAFRGNELLISEPNYAYAFPTDYRLTVEDKIVALGHTDNTIIVLTEGRPYLVSGTEPSQMQITHLPIEQSCVSAQSVGFLPGGVLYASPDGLMLFTANDQSLATSQTYTRDQWQGLDIENLMGTVLDGQYIGFFAGTNKGIIFTIGAKDIVRIELPEHMKVVALYHHSQDDCIYLSVDGRDGSHSVWEWEAGEAMDYVWRSKPFFTSRLVAMRALRIEGDQTARQRAQVCLFGPSDARPREILKLENTRTKRVTTTRAEKLWSLELRGKATIFEARLGSSVEDLEYGG